MFLSGSSLQTWKNQVMDAHEQARGVQELSNFTASQPYTLFVITLVTLPSRVPRALLTHR